MNWDGGKYRLAYHVKRRVERQFPKKSSLENGESRPPLLRLLARIPLCIRSGESLCIMHLANQPAKDTRLKEVVILGTLATVPSGLVLLHDLEVK